LPELPEVEAVRHQLAPVMEGHRIVDVDVRRPDLRVPFPRRFRARLKGQPVVALTRRAKYLLATLGSTETLLMHLGMSGSFRVEVDVPAAARHAHVTRHDHVVFLMDSDAVVHFNDPRRFGLMDLLSRRQLANHPVLSRLGPEPLSKAFNAAALARACARRSAPLKAVLLDQSVVAGLGNIYASEALHLAGLAPQRRASTIATAAGAPRPAADRLAKAIKQVLRTAIERPSSRRYRSSRFRVYDRAGERCLRAGCGGTIRRVTQAGRSTFYCPVCQR
jgi:formamidopyrimidine-DNA glycosylase